MIERWPFVEWWEDISLPLILSMGSCDSITERCPLCVIKATSLSGRGGSNGMTGEGRVTCVGPGNDSTLRSVGILPLTTLDVVYCRVFRSGELGATTCSTGNSGLRYDIIALMLLPSEGIVSSGWFSRLPTLTGAVRSGRFVVGVFVLSYLSGCSPIMSCGRRIELPSRGSNPNLDRPIVRLLSGSGEVLPRIDDWLGLIEDFLRISRVKRSLS
jgi:hypothetical protein